MTTRITVHAGHGWPVDVYAHALPADPEGNSDGVLLERVPAGETRDFVVHSSRDLFVHEVQPSEIQAPAETATA